MATLSEIRSRLASKLGNDQVIDPTSAQIDQAINYTIDYYETDTFWFNQDVAELTATAGNRVLSTGMPADFKQEVQIDGLTVVYNQVWTPLRHITPLQYDSLNAEQQGLPIAYIYRDGNFELFPYPDQAYTIRLFYIKSYSDLATDGGSNDFTNYATRLIEYKTLIDLLLDYRCDSERALTYQAFLQS